MPCGACGQYVSREYGCKHAKLRKRDRNYNRLTRYNDKWVWPEGITSEEKRKARAREYARRKRESLTSDK